MTVSPLIGAYVLLVILGVSNLIRFSKTNAISKNLLRIYIWALTSNVCWILFFLTIIFVMDNLAQYLPYATAIYCKIQVGVAYQASIFDLKYVVTYYFKQDMTEEQFQKKRKTTDTLMTIWSLIIFLFFLSDIGVNYFDAYFFVTKTAETDDASVYMIISYVFVSAQFIILTVLILWQTCLLIKVIKIMGTRLATEQSRLKILMYIFAFSYILVGVYYILRVSFGLACTNDDACIRF